MQKGSAGLIILIIALIFAGLAGAYFFGKSQTIKPQSPIPQASQNPSAIPQACTDEAMVCPDGSAVGRTGPNCEFAPCPDTDKNGPTKVCTLEVEMCPDGSAVGRTGPNCEFARCPGKNQTDIKSLP